MKTIQWSMRDKRVRDSRTVRSGKWSISHYINPKDETKTLCGKKIPTDYLMIDYEKMKYTVECISCFKLKLKKDKNDRREKRNKK